MLCYIVISEYYTIEIKHNDKKRKEYRTNFHSLVLHYVIAIVIDYYNTTIKYHVTKTSILHTKNQYVRESRSIIKE